jgi:MFS family permease
VNKPFSFKRIGAMASTSPSRKAGLAAWLASAVEYYDFFIYGTAAALVFGKLFFPSNSPGVSTLSALATFGVGYLVRPLGAVLIGHLGDRFGRRQVLTITLLLMGTSTLLIGLLPTYAQAGPLAPVLLVMLRVLQGLSVSGEAAGASAMALEHAPPARRAFFASFTTSGTTAGSIAATLVFIPIAALPEADLLSWGWRIPFLASIIVVVVGLWVRSRLPETPAFLAQQSAVGVARFPVLDLLASHGRAVLRVALAATFSTVSTIFSVHALAQAAASGLQREMLSMLLAASTLALLAMPFWAWLADCVGRKRVFIGGVLGCGVLIWPYLAAVVRGDGQSLWTFGLLLCGLVYSATNAVWPAFFSEMFSTRVRLTGVALGTQFGFALGGLAPMLAATIAPAGQWMPVAALVTGVCALSALAAATARETRGVATEQL